MSLWTFLIVAVIATVMVPAIGGIMSDYKLQKMKSSGNEKDVEELKSELRRMKKRLENLEAIAAADPDGFERNAHYASKESNDFDNSNHAQEIENILERKRSRL